ncbi:MAG: UDP binding domain-containing protein, partial [Verrucomicrobiota bacterium]
VKGARVLILGWTFKENVPDIRNTRVIDIHRELASYGIASLPHDPLADPAAVEHEYGVHLLADVDRGGPYDAIILAVKHRNLVTEFTLDRLKALGNGRPPLIMDVKGFFPARAYCEAGLDYWQL